jgi:hypothetical protein
MRLFGANNESGGHRGSRLTNPVMSDSISVLAGYRDRIVSFYRNIVHKNVVYDASLIDVLIALKNTLCHGKV